MEEKMELKFEYESINLSAWLNNSDITIIIAPGVPQYLTKYHPFVQAMLLRNVNLFIPRYLGSFESEGLFTLQNCVDTLNKTIRFVKEGNGVELFNDEKIIWSSNKIILVGFSFGALPSLLTTENVDQIILVAPFTNLEVHQKYNGEDLLRTFSFVKKAYHYHLNPESLLKECALSNYPKQRKNISLVYGKKDNSIPKEELDWVHESYKIDSYIKVEGGHSLEILIPVFDSIIKNE